MSDINHLDKNALYELIKKAASDAIDEKMQALKLQMVPIVSDEEMKDIENCHGSLSSYDSEEFEINRL